MVDTTWYVQDHAERKRLALAFDVLMDHYIAQDRWDVVRQAEGRWLIAYGSKLAMQQIIDQYTGDSASDHTYN